MRRTSPTQGRSFSFSPISPSSRKAAPPPESLKIRRRELERLHRCYYTGVTVPDSPGQVLAFSDAPILSQEQSSTAWRCVDTTDHPISSPTPQISSQVMCWSWPTTPILYRDRERRGLSQDIFSTGQGLGTQRVLTGKCPISRGLPPHPIQNQKENWPTPNGFDLWPRRVGVGVLEGWGLSPALAWEGIGLALSWPGRKPTYCMY